LPELAGLTHQASVFFSVRSFTFKIFNQPFKFQAPHPREP